MSRARPGAWLTGAALVVVALALLGCRGGATGGAVTRGAEERPLVALTFDDGLNGETTRRIAELLERYQMRGTFFVVGQTLEEQAGLARDLMERGHVLANHSYGHGRAAAGDREYDELARTQAAFEATTDRCPRYFRPPFGTETGGTRDAVRRAGMRTALWDVEVGDWSETDAGRLASNVLAEARAGSIVLLHDGSDGRPGAERSVLIEALPSILEGLRARGLRGVGLGELLGEPAYLETCAAGE